MGDILNFLEQNGGIDAAGKADIVAQLRNPRYDSDYLKKHSAAVETEEKLNGHGGEAKGDNSNLSNV